MEPETLKDMYRRWLLEVWGEGRYEVADERLHAELVDHNRYEGQPDGRAGDAWAAQIVRRAFPDLRFRQQQSRSRYLPVCPLLAPVRLSDRATRESEADRPETPAGRGFRTLSGVHLQELLSADGWTAESRPLRAPGR